MISPTTAPGAVFSVERVGGAPAYPVLAGPEVADLLFSPGAPLFWRIALCGDDILAEHGAVLWVQEAFWQEYDPIYSRWRDPVIYAAHPWRIYDWSRPRGGNQRAVDFDVQHRATWQLRPPHALPRERARVEWTILHCMEDDYPGFPPDLQAGGCPSVLRRANPRLHYPCVVEVCHSWLIT